MHVPFITHFKYHVHPKRHFGALYIAVTLLSLHYALVIYINSSFLEQFMPNTAVGTLYTFGSGLTILFFLYISRVLRKTGNYYLTLLLTLLEFAALIGLSFSTSFKSAVPFFLIHHIVTPLILFNLDVFMEELIGKREQATGAKRGLFLSIMSFAGAIAPLSAGYLIGSDEPNFSLAYMASALVLVPFLIIIVHYFSSFRDPVYTKKSVIPAVQSFWKRNDIRNVFFAHSLLQLFFAWMVIYTPLYLITIIGLSWEQVGIILFIAIMAYVLFEYPIGIIADRFIGEKEMMSIGFVIIALATASLAYITSLSVIPWIIAMFITRIGASLVETTTESYFFKHTEGSDANIISFFRITRPLSFLVGAFIGSISLFFLPFSLSFVVLGLLMILGIFFTMTLKDTK